MYIAADTTPVDVDHTAHAGGPTMFTQRISTTFKTKNISYVLKGSSIHQIIL